MAACATRSKRRSRPQKRNCTLFTGREMVEPRLHEVEAEPTLLASCRSCPPPLYSSLLRVPIRVEMFEACRVALKGTGLRIRLAAVLVQDLKVQKILCGSKLVRSDARATEELTQALTNIVTFGFFGRMIACSLTFKILARLHSLLGLLRNVLSSVDEAEKDVQMGAALESLCAQQFALARCLARIVLRNIPAPFSSDAILVT